MLRFFAFQSFLGVIAAVLLTACGGGGGGSPAHVVIGSNTPTDGTTGVAYTGFTFSASGGSGSYGWTETGALPPGLSLSTTGALSGTPATAGTYSFMIIATDASNSSLTDSKTISIKIADSAIVISTSPAPPPGLLTHPYPGFAFTATGGSPPFTWTLKTGALPAGLTLIPDGPITGTVSSTAMSSTFTVVATDSAQTPQSAQQPFTVMVTDPGPPLITPTPGPPDGVNGTVYPGYGFTATGGFLPLMWSVQSGKLPDGLTLGTVDGSLAGMPTRAAKFDFTITVSDSRSKPATNSAPFSIVITNPPPPTINNTPPPTATVGTQYSFQFTARDGLAPLVWSATGLMLGFGVSPGGILFGTPTSARHFPITVSAIDQLKQSATPMPFTLRVSLARPAATFTPTLGQMTVARAGHTATLLVSGQVLVAGGRTASAELYDPKSEMFTSTGNMSVARSGHTATVLGGKVLIVGGGTQTAELYDTTTGMFTSTSSTLVMRRGQTATLLPTGKVLIAGGGTASAELYDPLSGMFTATGSMSVTRTDATATLLLSGEVLIAGGGTATAELYNPASGTFAATGSMSESRTGHTATLLTTDGSVLIVGPDVTAELYNPATRIFVPVGSLPLLTFYGNAPGVTGSTATLRKDGTVLIAGGSVGRSLYLQSLASAELYAPESEGFTFTASLNRARDGHTATLLGDGTVLVTGGINHELSSGGGGRPHEFATVLPSAELFR